MRLTALDILQVVMRLRRELADSEQAREIAQAQLKEANDEVERLWDQLSSLEMRGYSPCLPASLQLGRRKHRIEGD